MENLFNLSQQSRNFLKGQRLIKNLFDFTSSSSLIATQKFYKTKIGIKQFIYRIIIK